MFKAKAKWSDGSAKRGTFASRAAAWAQLVSWAQSGAVMTMIGPA